jgi:hypothetical protein
MLKICCANADSSVIDDGVAKNELRRLHKLAGDQEGLEYTILAVIDEILDVEFASIEAR